MAISLELLKTTALTLLRFGAHGVSNMFGGDTLLLNPETRLSKIERLYELAKRDQWNYSDMLKDKAYQSDLTLLTPEERTAIARIVSQLYYGERGALLISSQLTTMVPDQESAAFLTTQCFDEARHMEVFYRIAAELDQLHPVNPFLQLMLTDLLRTDNIVEKLIGMNLLVEGLALSVFHHILSVFEKHPRLQGAFESSLIIEPLKSIVRDESRHVGFGVLYLPELVKKLSWRQKQVIRARQLIWLALLYGSTKYHEKDSALMGLSYMEVLKKVFADHAQRGEEMGLSVVVQGTSIHRLIPAFNSIIDTVLQHHVVVQEFPTSKAA